MLGTYVIATSTASVGPVVRIPGKVTVNGRVDGDGVNLFWAFATVELVLQSTRYFLERGKTGSGIGGWMGMASGLLGEPCVCFWIDIAGFVARSWKTGVYLFSW